MTILVKIRAGTAGIIYFTLQLHIYCYDRCLAEHIYFGSGLVNAAGLEHCRFGMSDLTLIGNAKLQLNWQWLLGNPQRLLVILTGDVTCEMDDANLIAWRFGLRASRGDQRARMLLVIHELRRL